MKKSKKQQQQQNSEPTLPKFHANWTSIVRTDRILMNVSDCQYEVVHKVGKQLKSKIKHDASNPEWDLWWTDWHVLPEVLMKMEHHQKINHFPGMFTLSRKNLLAKNLMKMRKKALDQYNFFPLTWNLPLDINEFKQYYQTKPKGKARTYIVKPQSMSQGKGIFLTRRIQDINPTQKCVVQRYLSKPYLIDGLKFDLRVYVLVASVDPLRVFVFRQGLGRFATEQYVMPNKDNMDDVCMHLTNYAINKENQKFVFNQDANDMSIGHKKSLEAVYKLMKEKGTDIDKLKLKIHEIIIKTLISGLSHLKFNYRSCQSENYRSDMCFQILGFDIMLTQQQEPMLLQINYTPSFSTDTPLDWNIKHDLIKDTLSLLEITKDFKERTFKFRKQCRDQRMMTGKKVKLTMQEKEEKRKSAIEERDRFFDDHLGGFTKIFPLEEENPQMVIYNQLIKKEAEASGMKEKPLPPKLQQNLIRRKTQNFSKLPQIKQTGSTKHTSSKQISLKRPELSMQKPQYNENIEKGEQKEISDSKFNKYGFANDISLKLMKKLKLKEIINKKKIVQHRETLVPKTVQFQGNKFDGLGQFYRFNYKE